MASLVVHSGLFCRSRSLNHLGCRQLTSKVIISNSKTSSASLQCASSRLRRAGGTSAIMMALYAYHLNSSTVTDCAAADNNDSIVPSIGGGR